MIRLSELTALDIISEKSVDINVSKIHCYEMPSNGRINRQILMSDTYAVVVNTRRYSSCPFLSNILLGTANFYPEDGLEIPNYHQNSILQTLMSDSVLPSLEFKTARLYFGQGLLNDSKIKGHYIKVFCKMQDESEVVLASIVDFRNDTNAIAVPAKYFESQIYNEAIDFEFLDVDFLLNSENVEVDAIRDYLFGQSKPLQYFIEYGAFTDDGIDDFDENGYSFTKISNSQINQQSILLNVGGDEMLASAKLFSNDFAILSRLYHERFSIEEFMNSKKSSNEYYDIRYIFTVDEYVSGILINTTMQTLQSTNFESQIFRPLVSNDCEYAKVSLTIRVHNVNTGMIFRRDTVLLLTDDVIKNFKALPSISLNVTSIKANKIVNRQIQKIVQSTDTPKVLRIENRTYVQSQPLNIIILLNGKTVVELNLSIDITSYSKLFLKIGNVTYSNIVDGRAMFELDEIAFNDSATTFLLLDSNMRTISSGPLARNSYETKLAKNSYEFDLDATSTKL